jgi:hypothetical protein
MIGLLEALKDVSLTSLDISSTGCGISTASKLAELLSGATKFSAAVTRLSLGSNPQIGDKAMVQLLDALKDVSLTSLDISSTGCGISTASKLAELLSSATKFSAAGIVSMSRLFGKGCVHYSLCLKGDDLTAAQKSISPLQRAARYGHLSIVRIVLDEVLHPQALPAVLDATTHYDHTALHWSAVFNHDLVAAELIRRGCDTAVLNHRGKTAWEVAEACGSADVMAVFESCASSPSPLDSRAPSSLHEESIRRARRPDVKDTFRDDIQLDPARLDFWSLKPFDHWKLLGDGMYGKVFGTRADPAVQVGDRRFCKLALKVPKQIGAEELKGEVESLSQLSHENVTECRCF